MLLLVALLLASQPLGPHSVAKTVGLNSSKSGKISDFQNWRVGCDNVRTCRAYSFPNDDDVMNETDSTYEPRLIVDRAGDPRSQPNLLLDEHNGHAVSMEWDGGKRVILLKKSVDIQTLPEAYRADFIDALRSQSSLILVGPNRRVIGHIALAGARAALLWMDDQQHRIGTETALAAPGKEPASAVPAPPALPIVHKAKPSGKVATTFDKTVLARLVGRKDVCTEKNSEQAEFARIDSNHTLALVYTAGCADGINDEADAYVITDGHASSPKIAKFDAPTDDEGWIWYDQDKTLGVGFDDHGPLLDNEQDIFVWNGSEFQHSLTRRASKGELINLFRAIVIQDK